MQIRNVHPFPARMAPELALNSLKTLTAGSVVLDPMAGSGTVLRQAIELGHQAIGFDMDPLAVLMSKVWTSAVEPQAVERELSALLGKAEAVDLRVARPAWQDRETREFIEYWFDVPQRRALARLAVALSSLREKPLAAGRQAAVNVLQVAMSRIIVTKEQGASLARDTSHSRPHRVAQTSSYDVFDGFTRSVQQLARRLGDQPKLSAAVSLGDARHIELPDASVDAIMTSPPYLNAIDYMRGHRMSLVWLGHSISDLRAIRSNTVGAERAADKAGDDQTEEIAASMCELKDLEGRHQSMIRRYADDLRKVMAEAARVLKRTGQATYVVGNSCLKDVFIRNSDGVTEAGRAAGLTLMSSTERDLPAGSRYLPVMANGSLSKRMRTETVLNFRHA